jgi:hypothetical protein
MDNFTLYMDLGKSSISCQPYFHHRVDYYPRKQQIIYRHTAKKTVDAFIVGAFDAA